MTEPAKRMDLAAYTAAINERIKQLIQYQKEPSDPRNSTAQSGENAQGTREENLSLPNERIKSS